MIVTLEKNLNISDSTKALHTNYFYTIQLPVLIRRAGHDPELANRMMILPSQAKSLSVLSKQYFGYGTVEAQERYDPHHFTLVSCLKMSTEFPTSIDALVKEFVIEQKKSKQDIVDHLNNLIAKAKKFFINISEYFE